MGILINPKIEIMRVLSGWSEMLSIKILTSQLVKTRVKSVLIAQQSLQPYVFECKISTEIFIQSL